MEEIKKGKLIETGFVDMNLMFMKIKIFKELKHPWFERGKDLSEDWNFCLKLREQGFKIWTDPTTFVSSNYPVNKDWDIYKYFILGRF